MKHIAYLCCLIGLMGILTMNCPTTTTGTSTSTTVSTLPTTTIFTGHYVDDFASGDAKAQSANFWYWYGFVYNAPSETFTADFNSGYGHITYNLPGTVSYGGAGMGLDASPGSFDISTYSSIRFSYKVINTSGSLNHGIRVEINCPDVTANMGWDYAYEADRTNTLVSTNWTTVTVNYSQLLQPSWCAPGCTVAQNLCFDSVSAIKFTTGGDMGLAGSNTSAGELFVDNIYFQ